jgi:threonine dehydrogenase-like Zn-dependent dehydrogenase
VARPRGLCRRSRLQNAHLTSTSGLGHSFPPVLPASFGPLLSLIVGGRIDPTVFATHRFPLGDVMAAYDVFGDAAKTEALKVVLETSATVSKPRATAKTAAGV